MANKSQPDMLSLGVPKYLGNEPKNQKRAQLSALLLAGNLQSMRRDAGPALMVIVSAVETQHLLRFVAERLLILSIFADDQSRKRIKVEPRIYSSTPDFVVQSLYSCKVAIGV
jgi:hypothetical protein